MNADLESVYLAFLLPSPLQGASVIVRRRKGKTSHWPESAGGREEPLGAGSLSGVGETQEELELICSYFLKLFTGLYGFHWTTWLPILIRPQRDMPVTCWLMRDMNPAS